MVALYAVRSEQGRPNTMSLSTLRPARARPGPKKKPLEEWLTPCVTQEEAEAENLVNYCKKDPVTGEQECCRLHYERALELLSLALRAELR